MPWRRRVPFNPLQSCSSRMNQKEDGFKRVREFDLCCVCSQDPSISRFDGVWWQIKCGAFGRGKSSRMVFRSPAWSGRELVLSGTFFSQERREKAQAWHTPSFYSGLCSNVTYSERLPLSILSKMILRFSTVFYYNLVFSLKLWKSGGCQCRADMGSLGEREASSTLFCCFVLYGCHS